MTQTDWLILAAAGVACWLLLRAPAPAKAATRPMNDFERAQEAFRAIENRRP